MQLQKHYASIAEHGVALYAVSVDPPEASEALRRRLGIAFTFLSDPEGRVLDKLGIRHRAGRRDGADIAYPTQVLVDRDGVVRWTYTSESYRVRARPEDIFTEIATLPASGTGNREPARIDSGPVSPSERRSRVRGQYNGAGLTPVR